MTESAATWCLFGYWTATTWCPFGEMKLMHISRCNLAELWLHHC